MKYQGQVKFKARPRKVWETVLDMEQFAACFPGISDVEMIDERTFRGGMKAKVGPVSGDFSFQAKIVEVDEPIHLKAEVEGTDSLTRSSMTAVITMDLSQSNEDTELGYFSEVKIIGRLAIIGDMVIRATGAQVIGEFFNRLRDRVEE